MSKKIITISREFGSGGRYIGEEIAKKLGMKYYDKNVIIDIAKQTGLPEKYIEQASELYRMDNMSHMSKQNKAKDTERYRTEKLSPVLPEMQTGNPY